MSRNGPWDPTGFTRVKASEGHKHFVMDGRTLTEDNERVIGGSIACSNELRRAGAGDCESPYIEGTDIYNVSHTVCYKCENFLYDMIDQTPNE